MCSETASPPTAAAWWATEAPVLPFLETVLTEGFKAGKRPLNVTLREAVEPGIPLLPGSVVPGSQRRRHTWKEMSDIGPAADFRGRGVGHLAVMKEGLLISQPILPIQVPGLSCAQGLLGRAAPRVVFALRLLAVWGSSFKRILRFRGQAVLWLLLRKHEGNLPSSYLFNY